MIHNKIVEFGCLFFFFLVFKFKAWSVSIELNLPFLLKLLPVEQCFPKYSDSCIKHIGISSFLEILINLAHIPFEFALIESLDIARDQFMKDF
jgi:hypothetical protein